MPGVSSEFIKQYIIKLINFFKSYKIDIVGFNTIYKFDDKFMNWIKIIDGMEFTVNTNPHEYMMIKENLINKCNFNYKEKISPKDKLYLDIRTWVYLVLGNKDDAEITDTIYQMLITSEMKDDIGYEDIIGGIFAVSTYEDRVEITPKFKDFIISTVKSDFVKPHEEIFTMMRTLGKYDNYRPEDCYHMTLEHLLASVMRYVDIRKTKVELNKNERFPYRDKVFVQSTQ